MTSAPSIGFDYRPSRWPRVGLVAMGALAVAAIFYSGLAVWLALPLVVAVGGYVRLILRRRRTSRVCRVTWRSDGGWRLHLDDDSDAEARLLAMRMVAGAIFLRLGWSGRQREDLLLFQDNLDGDTRRRLRMRLSASTDTH